MHRVTSPPALEEPLGVRGDSERPGDLWVLSVCRKYRRGTGAQHPALTDTHPVRSWQFPEPTVPTPHSLFVPPKRERERPRYKRKGRSAAASLAALDDRSPSTLSGARARCKQDRGGVPHPPKPQKNTRCEPSQRVFLSIFKFYEKSHKKSLTSNKISATMIN